MDITTYKVCKNLVNNVLINGGGADLSDYAKKDHTHNYTTEEEVKELIEENGGTGGNVDLTGYVKEEQLDNYAEKDHTHAEYMTEDEVLNIVQNNAPPIDTSNLVTKEELNNIDTYNFFTITYEHDAFSVNDVVQNVRNTWFEFIHTSITNNNGYLNYLHFNPKMIVKIDFERDNERDNNYTYIYLTYDTSDTFNIYSLLNEPNKYSIVQPTGEEGVDWDVVSCEYPPLSNVSFESLEDIPDLSTSDIIITPGLKNCWSYSGYCNEFVTIKKTLTVDVSNLATKDELSDYAKIYRCTQDEYVAITDKDPNTLYIII